MKGPPAVCLWHTAEGPKKESHVESLRTGLAPFLRISPMYQTWGPLGSAKGRPQGGGSAEGRPALLRRVVDSPRRAPLRTSILRYSWPRHVGFWRILKSCGVAAVRRVVLPRFGMPMTPSLGRGLADLWRGFPQIARLWPVPYGPGGSEL
jgi:hypothetical protein